MREQDNLYEALIQSMDDEIRRYEEMAASMPKHEFSPEFRSRMNELLANSDTGASDETGKSSKNDREYRTVRLFGRSMRRAVAIAIAAVMILATTITAIAITKPAIYYHILEMPGHLRLTFSQEGVTEEETQEFKPVQITIPEGFYVVDENIYPFSYDLELENDEGQGIMLDQSPAKGTSMGIDTDHSITTVKNVKGVEVMITKEEGGAVSLLFNDGMYVYDIGGLCDEELLWTIFDEIIDNRD